MTVDISDLKEGYLIERSNDKIAEDTLESIKYSINRFEKFLEKKNLTFENIDDQTDLVVDIDGKDTNIITSNNLFDYFLMWMKHEEGYADSTTGTTYSYLLKFLDFLVNEGYIVYEIHNETTVSDYINHGETQQRDKWSEDYVAITPQQHQIVRENVPAPKFRNKLICDILMTTGMRRGELAALKSGDINSSTGRIDIPDFKGSESRVVFVPDRVRTKLKIYVDVKRESYWNSDSEYLFVTNDSQSENGGISPSRVSHIVKEGAMALEDQDYIVRQDEVKNYKYTAHSYRNGFADEFIKSSSSSESQEDANIYMLSEILNHSSIEQTEKYISDSDDETIKRQMEDHGPDL